MSTDSKPNPVLSFLTTDPKVGARETGQKMSVVLAALAGITRNLVLRCEAEMPLYKAVVEGITHTSDLVYEATEKMHTDPQGPRLIP